MTTRVVNLGGGTGGTLLANRRHRAGAVGEVSAGGQVIVT